LAPNSNKKRGRLGLVIVLVAALVGVLLIGVGRTVWAQSTQTASPTTLTDSISQSTSTEYQPMAGKSEAATSLIKMLLALAVVVVCIYVAVFLLKKLMANRRGGRSGNSLLEVIETAHLDPKKSLSLVRIADKSVLLGVTENQISVLTELDPERTLAAIQQTSQQQSEDGFMTMLKSASDKFRGQGTKQTQPQG
jgi:flagellar protein FliO/FliZ